MLGRAKRNQWDHYLAAIKAQGAGADPAPATQEAAPKMRRASRAGRFARAAGRAVLAAARTAAGLAEFAVWLGLNLAIAAAVIAAAEAAGARLPPWIVAAVNLIQHTLAWAAKALGFGT